MATNQRYKIPLRNANVTVPFPTSSNQNRNSELVLELPVGPTGPPGPQGPQGESGVINSVTLASLIVTEDISAQVNGVEDTFTLNDPYEKIVLLLLGGIFQPLTSIIAETPTSGEFQLSFAPLDTDEPFVVVYIKSV